MKQLLQVGIMSAPTIRFSLHGNYTFCDKQYSGEYAATLHGKQVCFEGELYDELLFTAQSTAKKSNKESNDFFTLRDVIIGVNFHWQRLEDQSFLGDLKIITGQDKVLNPEFGLIAINRLDIEYYLASVISSEMSATSSFELLKAHAVISRSWLLHPIRNPHTHTIQTSTNNDGDTHVNWYERDAHNLFDVCADDHCQRYQGITKQTSENVVKAIDQTRGLVLVSHDNGEICDARFYKSCGGVSELFENCWADEHYPYLEAVLDYKDKNTALPLPDLTKESEAEQWIRTSPAAFCNTTDHRILQQVLNDYDQETNDFYRWKVTYSQKELSELVRKRSGIDFGMIEDLIPVRRGTSGRLYQLKIVGSKRTMIIGKELEIRKWLSTSHLYSSAFVVDKQTTYIANSTEKQISFTLTGAGWGHGVGLCQIGAAVMADEGYNYQQILSHYFPNSDLKQADEL